MKVGEVVIGIVCPSPTYATSMEEYFGVRSAVGNPDIRLKLRVIPHEDMPEIPNSLFTTKTVKSEGFCIAGDLVCGHFLPEKREGEVWVKNILTKGGSTRILEQLFYQAFYSARKLRYYDAFLIHSSGVIREGAGFLFVGASGTGKSTIAKLSQGNLVLNDEICLIGFDEEDVFLYSTPFNGYFKEKSQGSAPLRAVLLLAQGPSHRLSEVISTDAVTTIFPEIVPPIGIEDVLTYETRISMIEFADRLVKGVPVRRLEFRPDPGFWEVIDREFL